MELRVEKISKRFGEKEVLREISFNVESGHALGLLGRNGAGKTTTLRILADIFRADSGTVKLDGVTVGQSNIKIGYLPEERGLYPKIKVGEQMVYIGRLRGMTPKAAKKSAMALLESLEAAEYWNSKLDTLSKGNQQKIQLAIAVLHEPDFIMLDEPFSGLDPVNAKMLKDMINRQVQQQKLVLFSSHQMPYVEEFCQHICILNRGRIVLDGRIRDIKKAYPRTRIAITPEASPDLFLREMQSNRAWTDIVTSAVCKDESVCVTLKTAEDKQKLFGLLAAVGRAVDAFSVIEPSLEEIFVEKAGDAQ